MASLLENPLKSNKEPEDNLGYKFGKIPLNSYMKLLGSKKPVVTEIRSQALFCPNCHEFTNRGSALGSLTTGLISVLS